MKDNSYVYAMDLSLRKGKNGAYSKPLVYECQPFLSSNLGGSANWSYKNAFKKAFPNANINIDVQGRKTKLIVNNPYSRILIKNSEHVSIDEFIKINRDRYYTHIHTASFEAEIDKLNDKVHQRLYLPDEVSPDYLILRSDSDSSQLTEDISNYFGSKGISKIVLKSAVSHEGRGNFFIDNIQDKDSLQKTIEQMGPSNAGNTYFLAEEQKLFPRVSRKTEKEKPDFLSFRLVGIVNQEGDVGHFIASKSVSSSIDSHQRGKMKCYFDEPVKTHQAKNQWSLEAHGPKDKYFGKGDKNKIDIEPALMQKISKRMYQLYTDIKAMSDAEFEQHIDELVKLKNALAKEGKIKQFSIEIKEKNELVNTPNPGAFARTIDAYPRLAASIAEEMVETNNVDLAKLATFNYYNHENYLEPILNEMSEQEQFSGLETANPDQLKYCIKYSKHLDLEINELSRQLLKVKMSHLEKEKAELTANPVAQSEVTNSISKQATTLQYVEANKGAIKKVAQTKNTGGPFTGPQSRLSGSLFTFSQATESDKEATKEAAQTKITSDPSTASQSRLSGSTLFTTLQHAESKNVKKEKQKSFAIG